MTQLQKFVIDASVGIKKFIIEPLTPKVDQLFECLKKPNISFYIPDLFYIECTNTLWKYIRAGQHDFAEAQANLIDLKLLRFSVMPTADLMLAALGLSVTYGISAYDACYAALSQQTEALLLTQDRRLVNALQTSAVDVQFFEDFDVPSNGESI